MQDGCEVYMDSYMASNGSCFMVTWTLFKNYLLPNLVIFLALNRVWLGVASRTTIGKNKYLRRLDYVLKI